MQFAWNRHHHHHCHMVRNCKDILDGNLMMVVLPVCILLLLLLLHVVRCTSRAYHNGHFHSNAINSHEWNEKQMRAINNKMVWRKCSIFSVQYSMFRHMNAAIYLLKLKIYLTATWTNCNGCELWVVAI